MGQSELSKKLGMRPGLQVVQLVNAPQGFTDLLGELPDGVNLTTEVQAKIDGLLVFIHNQAEFQALVQPSLSGLKYDGLCWLAYPKKSAKTQSDLSRDMFWALMEGTGMRPVTQISIDEVWSALRFRPADAVKSK
jgi:hypothetical protein